VVSCTRIGQELRLDPTQVRKDIEATGIVGKARIGYDMEPLIASIEEFLGWDNVTEAFLVGAGALGTALMGYEGFQASRLSIVAAFDKDPEKVGRSVHGKEILPLSKFQDLARRMNVHMGIVTVPAASAQEVAAMMVQGGIRAIWNFSPIRLETPEEVIVEDVRLSSSLALLSGRLTRRLRKEREEGAIDDDGNEAGSKAGL